MKLRQQSLPFIWGYKKLLEEITLECKDLLNTQQDYILSQLQEFFNNPVERLKKYEDNKSKSLIKEYLQSSRERNIKIRKQASFIFAALVGWTIPIRSQAIDSFVRMNTMTYELGTKDARMKTEIALKEYKGKFTKLVPSIINALRENEKDRKIPISRKSEINVLAREHTDIYDKSVARKIANTLAPVLVKTSIDEKEKTKELESKTNRFFKSNVTSVSMAKLVTSTLIAPALVDYYLDFGTPAVRWIVDNPQDTPCIIAANEVVILGEPFSNGLTSPPVHPRGHCTLQIVNLTDNYVRNIGTKLGLL